MRSPSTRNPVAEALSGVVVLAAAGHPHRLGHRPARHEPPEQPALPLVREPQVPAPAARRASASSSSSGAHLWLAMLQPRLVEGHAETFADLAEHMHFHAPTLVVYVLGILGVAYHLANGLQTFCMGWGIVSAGGAAAARGGGARRLPAAPPWGGGRSTRSGRRARLHRVEQSATSAPRAHRVARCLASLIAVALAGACHGGSAALDRPRALLLADGLVPAAEPAVGRSRSSAAGTAGRARHARWTPSRTDGARRASTTSRPGRTSTLLIVDGTWVLDPNVGDDARSTTGQEVTWVEVPDCGTPATQVAERHGERRRDREHRRDVPGDALRATRSTRRR